jgi:exonuclease VII small subunit
MANEMTDAERMTKYETQMENLITVVTRMDTKIDAWQANFVSKELLEEKLKSRDEKIENLNKKFGDLNTEKTTSKNNLPLWAAAIIAAVALIISLWPK